MSAPVVLSVEPGNLETDVILGIPIVVTFDQEIDPATITDATFCLTGPGTSRNNPVSSSCAQRHLARARPSKKRSAGRIGLSRDLWPPLLFSCSRGWCSGSLCSWAWAGAILQVRRWALSLLSVLHRSVLHSYAACTGLGIKLLDQDEAANCFFFSGPGKDDVSVLFFAAPPSSGTRVLRSRPPPPAAPMAPNLCPRRTPDFNPFGARAEMRTAEPGEPHSPVRASSLFDHLRGTQGTKPLIVTPAKNIDFDP